VSDLITQRFIDAITEHDGERLAALFAEDGTYEDLGLGGEFRGTDAIKAFIASTSNDLHLAILSEQASEDAYLT